MHLLMAALGRLIALAPECLVRALCAMLGSALWLGMPKRRRLVLANLRHAFPNREHARLVAIGRESCRGTIEMGLLALASPYFSDDRVRRMIAIDPAMKNPGTGLLGPGPVVMLGCHTTMMEAVPLQLLVFPEMRARQIGVFYRPLDNPAADLAVKIARERFGAQLLSRKDGFKSAMGILRAGGSIGILPDQNAGWPGAKSLFFGRLASSTELPGMLAEKFNAPLVAVWPERTGFWRCEMKAEKLADRVDADSAMAVYHRWLEKLLGSDDRICSQWLWMHNRWKHNNTHAHTRFGLRFKRDMIAADLRTLGLATIPRTGEHFVLRMPNWLGDVVMALPLVRAIRENRPDARITLLAKKPFVALLESLGVAERVLALPGKGEPDADFFRALSEEYPDAQVIFTNSFRGDNEARRIGAPHRFGMVRPGKWRPLLSHGWKIPTDLDETRVHQTRVWEQWLRTAHGLEAPLDLAPFRPAALTGSGPVAGRVGLVCGTENFPAKRWPVERWRELIDALLAARPGLEIRLFGTANDLPITTAVAAGFDSARVLNLAGKTGLLDYCRELTGCTVLACNDTGGMHLANMLGVPVVALFGPTNPLRTGPIFEARAAVLQPEGCPPTGGADIGKIPAARVAEVVLERL